MTRIFVVDDSAFNLKIVSATLAPAGYEVVTAGGGTEALERVDAIQPDLIIETGIAHGGSLIFYASMLELNAACGGPSDAAVVGVDVDIRARNRAAIEAPTIIAEVPEGAPPLRQAYSLMKNSSSSLIWPAFSALKVTASSMSLLMLAG